MKKHVVVSIFLVITFFSCNQTKKQKPTITFKVEDKVVSPKEVKLSVYGIDISQYQGDEISNLNKKTDSLEFIICKATEGITYTDPKFFYNWKMIKEKKFLRGSYHFYRSNDDPIAQANNYLNAISDIEKTDIPPIIDFEAGGINRSQSLADIQSKLKVFINQIETKLKCKPILYTDVITGNKYLKDSYFANYPLWIADYYSKTSPDLPKVWKDKGWLIWQRSSIYKLDGITDDLDKYNGSLQDFKKFIKASYY